MNRTLSFLSAAETTTASNRTIKTNRRGRRGPQRMRKQASIQHILKSLRSPRSLRSSLSPVPCLLSPVPCSLLLHLHIKSRIEQRFDDFARLEVAFDRERLLPGFDIRAADAANAR